MSGGGNEVIIEILQVGNAVKVVAVDAKSGLEVSIVGSPSMSEEMLNKINKEHFDFVQESVHEDLDKQELTPAFKNFKEKQLQMYRLHLQNLQI